MIPRNTNPRFELGRVVVFRSIIALNVEYAPFLIRHQCADWGLLLSKNDIAANEQAIVEGARILSYFQSKQGVEFYVVTEKDRSKTWVLLPEEYVAG